MNTEETVITPTEVVTETIAVVEVQTDANTINKLPNITVKDQEGNLVQTFTNVDEAIAFAGDNGYQVNIA